jgi:hypothetical protein
MSKAPAQPASPAEGAEYRDEAWWLDGHDRRFTSVSFLIDRSGAIRHIHAPNWGGRMAPGESDYNAMKDAIERYL